jgi:hypothetical protein
VNTFDWPMWRLEYFADIESAFWKSRYLPPNVLAETIWYYVTHPICDSRE